MSKLVDYTPHILFTIAALTIIVGAGYLIAIEVANEQELATQCIASGMQYIRGDCIK